MPRTHAAFGVSFRPEELAQQRATYNYGPLEHSITDMQGISTFAKDADGAVFHAYSCYARGVDMMNVHVPGLRQRGLRLPTLEDGVLRAGEPARGVRRLRAGMCFQ